jgi:hypothetical protein
VGLSAGHRRRKQPKETARRLAGFLMLRLSLSYGSQRQPAPLEQRRLLVRGHRANIRRESSEQLQPEI